MLLRYHIAITDRCPRIIQDHIACLLPAKRSVQKRPQLVHAREVFDSAFLIRDAAVMQTVWLVRHGDRADHADKTWRRRHAERADAEDAPTE